MREFRADRDAIYIVYKSLQQDTYNADISAIIRELHKAIDDVVDVETPINDDQHELYDISKIDFDRLKVEFARIKKQQSTVKNLRDAVDKRLADMMSKNPLRTDFQKHYEDIVAAYNSEKDRPSIEATFEALLQFVSQLDDEESRSRTVRPRLSRGREIR